MDDSKELSLFMDKIKLSSMVLIKESKLNSAMGEYIQKKNIGLIPENQESKWGIYNDCWRLLYELYSFMKHNKLEELRKKGKTDEDKEINQERYDSLIQVMDLYVSGEKTAHLELLESYDIITKFVSLSGYHDDKTRSEEEYDETPMNF